MKESYGITNVRVVAICPGLTNTPMIPYVKGEQIDFLKDVKKRVHTMISQSPENVASAVVSIVELGKPGDVCGYLKLTCLLDQSKKFLLTSSLYKNVFEVY